MAEHLIKIDVFSNTHELSYSHKKKAPPSTVFVDTPQGRTVHVDPGDTIEWFSDDDKFGIHFKDNETPFVSGVYSATAAKNTANPPTKKTPSETVRTHPTTVRYKYFVASGKTSGPKEIVTDDPDIIVDGTGGGT